MTDKDLSYSPECGYEQPPTKGDINSYLSPILKLYSQNKVLIESLSKQLRLINNTILVLSVVTTGGLWMLITGALPDYALWVGAIISTVVTGLTLYLKSSGMEAKKRKALAAYGQMSEFIGNVRGGAIKPGTEEFWIKIKMFQNELVQIDYGDYA